MQMDLARNGVVHGCHLIASEKVVARGFTKHPLVPNIPEEDFFERTRRDDFLPTPWSTADWGRLGIKPPPDDDVPPVSPRDPLDDLPHFDSDQQQL